MATSKDDLVSAFCNVTGLPADEAIEHLSSAEWDSDIALANYFEAQDAEGAPAAAAAAAAPEEPAYTGPRTLDGRPAPQSVSGSSSSASRPKQPAKKKGLMTMSSLMGSGHGGHDHDDEDEEDEEDDGRGDLFAGGEKSGLAVQDPKMGGHPQDAQQKMIRDIIAKAKANRGTDGEESDAGPSQPTSSRFHGSGQTLGGEGVPSRTIPDPSGRTGSPGVGAGTPAGGQRGGARPSPEDVQERVLHIWQDGFSIDDGELHRFDDPNNAADLQMIRQGRAPLHLMNVQFGQAVDVKLHQHQEQWHQLPKVYRPFSGEGRRLGSPVPGDSARATPQPTTATTPLSASATVSTSTGSGPVVPTIDESQPTLTIRVQLPDGTRLPARFNTTQTIGDVYEFVERALPSSAQTRAWVIATTFPNKDHTDRGLVLGETAEFKRGGAAVVKWV